MICLITGGAFAIGFLLQILIFRVYNPIRQYLAIFLIFTISLFISLAFVYMANVNVNINALILLIVLYISLMVSYLIVFTGVEELSPSLLLINLIKKNPMDGSTYSELVQEFERFNLIDSRILGLNKGGIIFIKGEKIELTTKGLIFFWVYKKLILSNK